MAKIGTVRSSVYGTMDVELERGYYVCLDCGNPMVTVLWTQEEGRLIIKMEPLLCPRCATARERKEASRRLSRILGRY
jgi:DNA-directed RNA polymerase subunit RPC12/RpoP